MLHDMWMKERKEDIWYTRTQTYSLQTKKEEITVSISITGHLTFLSTFFPLSVSFAIRKHLSLLWFFTLWGDPNLFLKGVGH